MWSEEQGMHPAWEREDSTGHHKIKQAIIKSTFLPGRRMGGHTNHWCGKSYIQSWKDDAHLCIPHPSFHSPAWRGSGYQTCLGTPDLEHSRSQQTRLLYAPLLRPPFHWFYQQLGRQCILRLCELCWLLPSAERLWPLFLACFSVV